MTTQRSPKRALVTGITGQDGSYLTELLLKKGYEVHGVVRRASTFNTERIDHLYVDRHEIDESKGGRLFLHFGDLNDASSLQTIVEACQPTEVYNLGAQSHVRVSFDIPEYTGEITALGTVRLLEAIRKLGVNCRFYQASSSELYGKVVETPQRETTPFHPRSPYAAAKAYAFYITQNYREGYGLFACNGILFNHECLSSRTPLIVRRDGLVDVVTPDELVPLRRKGANVQQFELQGLEVWDGKSFVALPALTATKRRTTDADHSMVSLEARAGIVETTAHHGCMDAERERRRADSFSPGQRVMLADGFPETPAWTAVAPELAELMGYMAAEGYVPADHGTIQFTSNDERQRSRVAELWSRVFLGETMTWFSKSGFAPHRSVGQLNLNGAGPLRAWLREQLYTKHGYKRVPKLILNADLATQKRFLDAYYEGDGLKAGNGDSIKTNSPLLAQGLCWMYALQGRQSSVYVEHRGEATYFQLNLSGEASGKGQHLRKDPAEVRKLEPAPDSEWVFDVETESRLLLAGVGRVVVHNSERRGETFVTRKITRALGRIKHGMQKELFLGNLDAKRDWGHAEDYVEAMWLMLQHERADDFVIGTGETYSVREFAERAFGQVGLDYKDFVKLDPRYLRPAEVDLLLSDPSKAKKELGWAPKVSFAELVRRMVESDMELAAREKRARG